MKLRLTNVRISFPDIFTPGKKYGKFGAQFRFSDEGIKASLDAAIDSAGSEAFKSKWEATKKTLQAKEKLFRVNSGADKGYDDTYFISVHNALRPEVRGRKGEVLAEEDRVIYPGCRVDAILDVSAYSHDTYGPIVSVKLLGVQFRSDDKSLTGSVRADTADFQPITSDDTDDL